MNNKNKTLLYKMNNNNYATNLYLLNVAEVYKDCNLPNKQFLHTNPEPIYASNCEPKINYNCPYPNNIKCWKEPSVKSFNDTTDIVSNNIKRGGLICDFKPRSEINEKISCRFLTDFIKNPCDYVQDVETEFYLKHGENSKCSSIYWKNRHSEN